MADGGRAQAAHGGATLGHQVVLNDLRKWAEQAMKGKSVRSFLYGLCLKVPDLSFCLGFSQ